MSLPALSQQAFLSVALWSATVSGIRAGTLDWHLETGFRWASLEVPASGRIGFERLPSTRTDVTFTNRLSDATIARNRLLEIGSGVALGDVDGDGWIDIYLCGLENDNALYRNLGDWRFEDVTAHAGVGCPGQFSTGAALVDLDGDGHLDLLVNSLGGGTRLFRNDASGRFREDTSAGLHRQLGATSLALADIDGDGDLDLYVTNYRTDTFLDQPPGLQMGMRDQPDGTRAMEPFDRFVTLTDASGTPLVLERGEPDILYLNRGRGRFQPIPWHTGLFLDEDGRPLRTPPSDWGLAVTFRDLNGDGRPDLYVANDFILWTDRLWLNEEGRRFRAAPRTALRSVSLASMAVDVADINRDGHDDLFVADMLNPRRSFRAWQRPDTLQHSVRWPFEDPAFRPEVPRNTLQLARGDGTFAEIGRLAGVAATDWTPAALFLDVDLDGWEDLLVTAGNRHDVQDLDALASLGRDAGGRTPETRRRNLSRLPHRRAPSLAFRNRRDLTFEERSDAWGFNQFGVAHGLALGDLDNDGDLDVVVNCMDEPARLLRNESSAPRLAIRLSSPGESRHGIGARIRVRGGPVEQTQTMMAGGRFASSDAPMRVFAAGTAQRLDIEVSWPDGSRTVVHRAVPNRLYEIARESARLATAPSPASVPTRSLFEDVSQRLSHTDIDRPFDDFSRHPLLPRKLSRLGPGLGWADTDGDGIEDLVIPGGTGGRTAIFRGDRQGGFREWTPASLRRTNTHDQTTALFLPGRDGIPRLLIGQANWEDGETNAPLGHVVRLDASAPSRKPTHLGAASSANPGTVTASTGPLALADIDGDGDLDLFVGGRVVPSRYPEPAGSLLILNDNDDEFATTLPFPYRGLVSGALFSDFDADGDPDLLLACEWDALRVFRNDGATFTDVTAALGIAPLTGFWNGVAAGDFDGDGRLDYIASNWGRNWRPDPLPLLPETVFLYHGDFAETGGVQTLLASKDPALGFVTAWADRATAATAIPAISARFPTFHAYGQADIRHLLGPATNSPQRLEATTFESTVFLNRGAHFEPRPLPVEAQFAPAFGLAVADFDGDGHDDVFLAQNFFGLEPTARLDAGTGLILLGNGQGAFHALPVREAGFAIFGEQRGCAVADFDADGRPDLAVSQNDGPTRLLRNRSQTPGVRVTIRGPAANPTGVGSTVRLRFGDTLSPAREVHAGGGYWSQSSPILLWRTATPPTGVFIRWPGGATNEWPWPIEARAIQVSPAGPRAIDSKP